LFQKEKHNARGAEGEWEDRAVREGLEQEGTEMVLEKKEELWMLDRSRVSNEAFIIIKP